LKKGNPITIKKKDHNFLGLKGEGIYLYKGAWTNSRWDKGKNDLREEGGGGKNASLKGEKKKREENCTRCGSPNHRGSDGPGTFELKKGLE